MPKHPWQTQRTKHRQPRKIPRWGCEARLPGAWGDPSLSRFSSPPLLLEAQPVPARVIAQGGGGARSRPCRGRHCDCRSSSPEWAVSCGGRQVHASVFARPPALLTWPPPCAQRARLHARSPTPPPPHPLPYPYEVQHMLLQAAASLPHEGEDAVSHRETIM